MSERPGRFDGLPFRIVGHSPNLVEPVSFPIPRDVWMSADTIARERTRSAAESTADIAKPSHSEQPPAVRKLRDLERNLTSVILPSISYMSKANTCPPKTPFSTAAVRARPMKSRSIWLTCWS